MRNKTVWALLLALMIMTVAAAGLAEPPKATEGIVIPVIENMSTYTVPDN